MKKIALIIAAAAIAATATVSAAGCSVKSAESSRPSSSIIQTQNDSQFISPENTVASYDIYSEEYGQENTIAAYDENE